MKKLLFLLALMLVLPLQAAKRPRSSPLDKWRKACAENSPRELELLTGSETCFRKVRAELGDAALFERMAQLLKKQFRHYDAKTVNSALKLMKELQGAVDPVRAATDYTHIRSRVEIFMDKEPDKWRSTIDTLDATIKQLQTDYR